MHISLASYVIQIVHPPFKNSGSVPVCSAGTRSQRGPLVLHTMAYLRGTLPFGLKGRFYANVAFYPEGKILCQSFLYT